MLKEIRAYDPHAPVIVLGGGATEEQENQARGLRVTDFIRKGLSLDVLVECISRIVQLPEKPISPPPEAGSAAMVDTGETILVVDDESLVRDLLVQFLSLRGYRALGVKDGPEALSMVKQSPPDLILLDLFMPGMDGVEVARRVKQVSPRSQIVVLTSYHEDEHIFPALKAGALSWLAASLRRERPA